MNEDNRQGSAPGMDRVLASMCHHLNNRLAAVNGYVFLLRRREQLGSFDGPLQEQLDHLARSIRVMRTLLIDAPPSNIPVSLADLVETATEVMSDAPEGPTRFVLDARPDAPIIRADWTRLLRTILQVGLWLTHGHDRAVEVSVGFDTSAKDVTLVLSVPEAPGASPRADPTSASPRYPAAESGFDVRIEGSRVARIIVNPCTGTG